MKKAFLLLGLVLMGAVGMAQDVVETESRTYSFSVGNIKDKVRLSDVDMNIPQTRAVNDMTFCIIFANEKYQMEQSVPFAAHDGEVFKDYCVKTLGIPEKNIHYRANATKNNMEFEVDWLANVLANKKGEAKGIVYYSGHGIPNESDFNSYLLPVDGYASRPESGYSLDKLYADLGNTDAALVTYFIDACFSGTNRRGEMMEQTKGVGVKSKSGRLQGNSVVFSAAQGDETAYVYQDKSHGMFTYFLLQKLQETKGNVSYGELSDFIKEKVVDKSLLENSKSQTPLTSSMMGDWKKMKFNK
ncbi:MAG: caspase family protein [Bacteroidales bacterium]|nr:caspase family protein [Bacteroidales bacterium]